MQARPAVNTSIPENYLTINKSVGDATAGRQAGLCLRSRKQARFYSFSLILNPAMCAGECSLTNLHRRSSNKCRLILPTVSTRTYSGDIDETYLYPKRAGVNRIPKKTCLYIICSILAYEYSRDILSREHCKRTVRRSRRNQCNLSKANAFCHSCSSVVGMMF